MLWLNIALCSRCDSREANVGRLNDQFVPQWHISTKGRVKFGTDINLVDYLLTFGKIQSHLLHWASQSSVQTFMVTTWWTLSITKKAHSCSHGLDCNNFGDGFILTQTFAQTFMVSWLWWSPGVCYSATSRRALHFRLKCLNSYRMDFDETSYTHSCPPQQEL